jgi:pimeloyl-ACP methyl ester carboxylesterase
MSALATGTVAALAASLVPATASSAGAHAVRQDAITTRAVSRDVPRLDWGKCPDYATAPGVRCATLEVPLDHDRPDGPTIEIAVSRLRSTDPAKRRGVLLTNSGGPGGLGLQYPAALADGDPDESWAPLPASVRKKYDIIGFDPRGVGSSTPVTCDLPASYYSTFAPYARTGADVTRQAAVARKVARGCATSRTARLLPHMSTVDTARDMDLIRAALGEQKVSYLGVSYGTYLGAVYTSLFPGHSDRFVLDSALSPGGWDLRFQRRIAGAFEKRFPDFARYVASRPELGLGSTPGQVRRSYERIATKLDETPRDDGITGAIFRQSTFASLYYDHEFETLAGLWVVADQGIPLPADGSTPPRGRAAELRENGLASQLHVICNDNAFPDRVGTYRRLVKEDRRRFPMFGGSTANVSPCAFWPSSPQPKVRITDRGPANVLIAQNLRDPATPLVGARELRRAFGSRARMVTADAGGHLSYLRVGNTCLDDTVTRFLVTGERLRHDRRCPMTR